MRIKQMVTRDAIFWLADKFSFSAPEEMCNEQCGEYAYWCQGEKGLRKKKSNRLSRKGEKTFKAGNQILVLQKVYMFLFQSKVYARTDACKAKHTWNFRGVNQTLIKRKRGLLKVVELEKRQRFGRNLGRSLFRAVHFWDERVGWKILFERSRFLRQLNVRPSFIRVVSSALLLFNPMR